MKKLILISFVIMLSVGLTSCSKDSSSSSNVVIYQVPVDIAGRYITMAFCSASAGINMHLETASAYTAQGKASFDSSFTIKKLDSAATVKYQYQVQYTLARLTSPSEVSWDYTAGGSFSSSAILSQDEQNGTWTFTTLDQSQLTVNGQGTDGGTQYAVVDKVQFTSQFSYVFQNVMVDKMTGMVASGTATITINGAGPAAVHFNYSGTLTFLGNRQAVLVLGGSTFNFNLLTGNLTK
jgi:hypothetical protein